MRSVSDEPAERRERAQRLVEDVAARHLEHDVDLGAAVGLAQRGGELGLARVDGHVGAELERERALLLVEAVAITRPAPKRLASWTAIEPTPPAAAWTTTLSPSASSTRCAAGARRTGPG